MSNLLNFKLYFLIILSFILMHNANAQHTPPDPSQTINGRPIVPYTYNANTQLANIEHYNIGEQIDNRFKSLSFFNIMTSIAEPSTISPLANYTINLNGRNKKPSVIDADIQIPIALGGKRWYTNNFLHTIHLIPQFKIRLFLNDGNAPGSADGRIKGDISLPVRTPSYMPRITYYFSPRNWFYVRDTSFENGAPLYRQTSTFFGISAFHHSNGQDGPEFYDDPSIRVHNAEYGDINVYNGNFGEQVVFELIYGGIRDYRARAPTREPLTGESGPVEKITSNIMLPEFPYNKRLYWRASLEIHWPDILTNQDFLEYNLYGRFRLNLQSGLSWIPAFREFVRSTASESNGQANNYIQVTPFQAKERFRLVGNFQYILDPEYNDGNLVAQESVPYLDFRRLNLYGTLFWRMNGTPSTALFLQAGYWGSDQYNIYFQQSIMQFKAGIALAFFKYPKLGDFQREPNSR